MAAREPLAKIFAAQQVGGASIGLAIAQAEGLPQRRRQQLDRQGPVRGWNWKPIAIAVMGGLS
jgi:hypothetical protein